MRRPHIVTIAIALVVGSLAAMVGPAGAQGGGGDLPTLTVTSFPAEAGDYQMTVNVTGVTLIDPNTMAGGGGNDTAFLQYLVNGAPAPKDVTHTPSATNKRTFFFDGLQPGDVVAVELLHADGTSYTPRLVVNQTAAAAALVITSSPPTTTSTYWMGVDTFGFDLVGFSNASGNAPGEGHIDFTTNGQPAVSASTNQTAHTTWGAFGFTNLSAGDVLCAELVNHDHSSLSPRIMDCVSVIGADVEITSPQAEPGTYNMTVSASGHDGQLLYLLNGEPAGSASSATSHTFANVQAGDVLAVQLADASGNPLTPPYMRTMTVQAPDALDRGNLTVGGPPPGTGTDDNVIGGGGADASTPGFTAALAAVGAAAAALAIAARRR